MNMKGKAEIKNIFKILLILSLFLILACNKKEKKEIDSNTTITLNESSEKVTNEYQNSYLNINRVGFNSAGHLVVIFSKNISKDQNFKDKIKLNPEIKDLEFDLYGNNIIIKGDFQKEIPYNINISQDIFDVENGKLINDFSYSNLYLAKKQPNLSFSDSASVLPSLNNKRINFTSVNIKKIKLDIIKIFPNNITEFLKTEDRAYYSSKTEIFQEDLGELIFSKEYNLDNKTDEIMKNTIDLNGIIDSKGIYHINMYVDDEKDIDYDEKKYGDINYWEWINGKRIFSRISKNIILSDLGLIANSNDNKLDIKALDLNSLTNLSNIKLELVDKKNQIIEEGYTNFSGEYKSKINFDKVYYVLAKTNNEFNILYLDKSFLNHSDFDIGGLSEVGDLRLFVYTDKGYYRPGDEISVSLIARNKEQNIEDNHPFTYSLISPNGIEKINNVIVSNSKNGFYNFKIKTDNRYETGAWNLKIKFAGIEIDKPIFIEAKAPNRIAIEVDTDKIYTKNDINDKNELMIEVKGNYLSGIAASNSSTNYNIEVFEKKTMSKKYKNFNFENPTLKETQNIYLEGKLDENGLENVYFYIPATFQKSNLDIFMTTNILDSNGRYSTETKKINLINKDFSIGLKNSSQENGDIIIDYIVLNNNTDELIEGKKLKYRLFNKKYNWWFDNFEENEKYIKNSLETVIIDDGELISSKNPQKIKFSNLEEGLNFLEVEDEESGISSGIFIYNYSYGDRAKNGIENLNISSDKEKYQIGEKAKIKYTGVEGAKALISIEKDGKILKEFWRELSQKNNEENIIIEKDFFPNAYVNISVFQKYQDKENDRALRLYGSVPLLVDDEEKRINIVVDSAEEVKPSTKYTLKISNKEKQKMYFQYYFIDEGVLRLTQYKLPTPYNFFYGKQAKLVKNFDNFSNIIEKYSNNKIANYLKTGGGDFEEISMLRSAYTENTLQKDINLQTNSERFKNISIVSDILETDENGVAEVSVDIPNYFGALKLFIVATNNEKYGSFEKIITVKAPVIIEASAPRVLKVGDKFSIPVSLFPLEENLGEAKLNVKFENTVFSENINLTDKENKKFFFEFTAPENIGKTNLEISYLSKKYNFTDTVELSVDSSFPSQYLNQNLFLKSGEEFKIETHNLKDFIKSSIESELKISSYENLGLNKIIHELLDYPYICLEQTTSKGRAMLAITKLTKDENELNSARIFINNIIRKIANEHQLGNGSFSYWPGNSYEDYENSIYAIEFLIDAKNHGYFIPDVTYDKAISYLKSLINRTDLNINNKVSILHILASIDQANVSEMNIIFDKYYENLDMLFKWKLLDSYNKIGEKDFAKTEAKKLTIKTNSVYHNSEILKLHSSIFNEREEELFRELLRIIKSDTWLSTFSQANIIDAISKNVKDIDKKNSKFELKIDTENKTFSLNEGLFSLKEINEFIKNNKTITIKNISDDNLYINFLLKGKPVKFQEKDENQNIEISREFLDMKGNKIDVKNLKVGDRFSLIIKTKLKNIEFLDNLALSQILPSGWELANNQEQSENVNYVDIRDDRVAFFYDQSISEEKEIKIDINVVSPGEFYLTGTKIEAMYDNNFRAYLKGFTVKIEK